MTPSLSRSLRRNAPRLGLVIAVAAVGQLVLLPTSASAASSYLVSTTADVAANAGACGNPAITVAPSPLSLREATCLANNSGGAVTITIPAGTYNLVNGELQPGKLAGQTVTLTGAGAASTIINAGGNSRVLDIDPGSVGGVNSNLSGFTVTGGADSSFGGAGILAGSGNAATSDVMTIDSLVVTGNQANALQQSASNAPGGGMQFLGGKLTVTNSTFSGNGAFSSPGAGLFYEAQGQALPESLSVSTSTFSGNHATDSAAVSNGGALALFGASGNYTVTGSRFVNNTVTSTAGGAAQGAGVLVEAGTLSLTGSTFTGNSVSGGVGSTGGAIYSSAATALHYNRFAGNVAPAGQAVSIASGSVDAAENWWGCNTGPGGAGCDTVNGAATVSPRLVLTATASPATVVGPNATATITGSFTTDSLGGAVAAANLGAFAALPATFSDPPGDATVTVAAGSHTAAFSGGVASIDYHSNTTIGPDPDNVTFDNATVTATVTVDEAPAITSANTAHFNVGAAGSFTVTSTGYPDAALTETGSLPAGLTFTDNGDGSATLAGTATGPGGTFPLSLTANNGISPNATQTLTVTVGQPPAFTSPATATFTAGSAGSFTVTTSGIPTVSAITETGTLPSGLTFTDNGNGTATLAGTPAAGSGGSYPVTLGATNGVAPNGSQTLTIQVNQAPAVTTNPSDQTVNPGTSVTFTAAASGVPTPTVQWQRSTNGGASFTNIAGATSTSYTFTTAAGDNGNMYRAVFTNVVSTATTTAATLNVGTAPAFTSSNATTFAVGTAGNFAITTSGVPSATLSRTGAQFPAWLTLTDNGDGTGSLTGTPPVGSGGTYTFTLKAANGFSPSASQIFTLTVDESPTITSTNHATFTVGSAGTFAVTSTAGFPTSTALTETGALPSGVSFVDNGDGTATLAGTAAAGTGGTYPLTISAAATGGITAPRTQSFTLTVNAPPVITSADHATFSQGAAGAFTVTTAAGFPAASTITKSGTLPSGVSFTDNGDGTATLAGTPAFSTGGIYTLTITASNGVLPNATQSFTLTVNAPPVITSANHTTFTQGAAAAFTVTTAAGQPAATTITKTGTLPPGITFTDNGDGTATLAGTPTTGGVYPFTITASNGVAPDPTQSFTATVNNAPSITSADHTTFAVGAAGSFTVTTTPGTPASTTLAKTGTLPSGVSFTDNGDGTATLAGAPAVGQGGSYSLTITASNGVLPNTTQSFTLTVTELPTITSANHATFSVGAAGTFAVTTTAGYPTASTLTETGALPSGVTFTDNGNGTATLAGTPAAGTGGSYPLTITATNSSGHRDQSFTLTVHESPTITSVNHVTFTAGTAGLFTVTTAGGFPATPALTETGALPAGVSFVDNGDGTATLAGTATAGGVFALTITASNGASADATQAFTLTVNGPPSITSAATMTFTAGLPGTFSVTTRAGVPATPITLAETGALPSGVTFTDNGNGTATLAGTASAAAIGTYHLSFTASNGVNPAATQSFTLRIVRAAAITLPASLPPTSGLLHGVPPITLGGQLLLVSGTGYAAGAPITIGVYSTPIVLGHATANSAGGFIALIRVPNILGRHTFVAAGIGASGSARYLEAASLVISAPHHNVDPGGSGVEAVGGTLANTGPDTDPRNTAGYALAVMLAGLMLLLATRRRRRRS